MQRHAIHPTAHIAAAGESAEHPSAIPPVNDSATRLVYVDWLRIMALVGVFVLHVCEVFNPWDEWHITNAVRSRLAGEIVVLMAPWIMPLFMVLAGVTAWYSLEHRTNAQYLRERTMRLFLPLVVGVLVLVPPQVYAERRLRGQFEGSFIAFYPHFFQGIYPQGNLSWHHLWFLGHLFGYSLLALPLFRYWQRPGGRQQLQWLARVCRGPVGLLWLALPLVLERQLLWGLFPERHMLTSDWSNHAILFVAYLYGYVLAGVSWLGTDIDRGWKGAAVFAGGATVALMFFAWTGRIPGDVPPPYSPAYLGFWTVYAIGAWAWLIAVLGAGRRYLRRESTDLRRGGAVGFAAYMLHQPMIVGFAYWIVQWRSALPVKFTALLLVSLLATLLGAEMLCRLPFVQTVFGASPRRTAPV